MPHLFENLSKLLACLFQSASRDMKALGIFVPLLSKSFAVRLFWHAWYRRQLHSNWCKIKATVWPSLATRGKTGVTVFVWNILFGYIFFFKWWLKSEQQRNTGENTGYSAANVNIFKSVTSRTKNSTRSLNGISVSRQVTSKSGVSFWLSPRGPAEHHFGVFLSRSSFSCLTWYNCKSSFLNLFLDSV